MKRLRKYEKSAISVLMVVIMIIGMFSGLVFNTTEVKATKIDETTGWFNIKIMDDLGHKAKYKVNVKLNNTTNGNTTDNTTCQITSIQLLYNDNTFMTNYAGWNLKNTTNNQKLSLSAPEGGTGNRSIIINDMQIDLAPHTSINSVGYASTSGYNMSVCSSVTNRGAANGHNIVYNYITNGSFHNSSSSTANFCTTMNIVNAGFKAIAANDNMCINSEFLISLKTCPKYNIHYDGNGAETGIIQNQTNIYYDENITLSNVNAIYGKVGHELLGLSKNRNAAKADFYGSTTYKGADFGINANSTTGQTVNLYAIWKRKARNPQDSNVLKNIEKYLKVNIVKVDSSDETKTLNAKFNVYEWSRKLNEGNGAYKSTPIKTINSNTEYELKYTADNQGLFKVEETWVESPYIADSGYPLEIDMSKNCQSYYFYDNTMNEADKGKWLPYYPYAAGDIVRNNDKKDGAIYYRAKIANYDKPITDTNYWERLSSFNYDLYNRLVAGASDWNNTYEYAKVYGAEVTNDSPDYRSAYFSLVKTDESGKLLNGAHFKVLYADDGSDCNDLNELSNTGSYRIRADSNGTLISNKTKDIKIDDSQTHATLSEDGKTKNLHLIVTEDKVPDGYKKINDFDVYIIAKYNETDFEWQVSKITAVFSGGTIVNGNNGLQIQSDELIDDSYKFDLEIIKEDSKGYYDKKSLSGAVYGVYTDAACQTLKRTVTIGNDGTGTVTNLPVGEYWVKECNEPTSGLYLLSDEIQKVNKPKILFEQKPTVTLKFMETPIGGKVKVHKIDPYGKEINGAGFTLYKAPTGTTEENIKDVIPTTVVKQEVKVKDGYALFEDVPYGEYILVETTVPKDYNKADNELIKVEYEEGIDVEVYKDVVNTPIPKKIKIYKEDSLNNRKLEGAVFTIFDETTNKYISAGTEEGTEEEAKHYITDENGLVMTDDYDNIMEGHTYIIKEIEPPKGYLLDSTPQKVTIKDGDESGTEKDGTKYYSVTFKNHKTEISFEKRDILTSKEVEGGHYSVTETLEADDEEIKTIDEWDGNGKPYTVYGLVAGETYYFNEETAPDGYTIAQSVEFTVSDDGKSVIIDEENSNIVTMFDDFNKLEVFKADEKTEEPLAGASLELHIGDSPNGTLYEDENGKAQWVSEKTPKRFDRIPTGTYTLVETKSPNGYVVANSITFEVGESNEVQEITMFDDFTKTQFVKLAGDTGEPLVGVRLQVLDEDKKVVSINGKTADWVTDGMPYEIDYLTAGKTYYLHEVSAPSDYQLAEDIKFVAGEPWTDENFCAGDRYNNMEGTQFIDQGGNIVNWDDGVVKSEDNTDTQDKESISLKGWEFQITDADDNVIIKWTSDGNSYLVNGLIEGEVYYLHVLDTPEGYNKLMDDEIEFKATKDYSDKYNIITVQSTIENSQDVEDPEDGVTVEEDVTDIEVIPDTPSETDLVTITMVDKPKLVAIVKKSELGTLLDHAELVLIEDSTGEELYSWTTAPNVSTVFKLKNGKYTIHEVYAPGDYDLAKDIHFEVTDDTTEVEYEMVDEFIKGTIKVVKKDEKTLKPLEGVEYTLVGELVNGKTTTIKAKTDKDGEIVFGFDKETGKGTLIPGKYTITETQVDGHTLLKDPIEVELSAKLTKAEAAAQKADTSKGKWDKNEEVYRFFDLTYEVTNDAVLELPATGSNVTLYAIVAGVIIFLLAGLYLGLKKKKLSLKS